MKKNITIVTANFHPEDTAIGLYTTQFAEYLAVDNQVTVLTGFPYYPQWKIYTEYQQKENIVIEYLNGIKIIRSKQYVPSKVTLIKRLKMIFSFVLGISKNKNKVKECDVVICLVPFTFSIFTAYKLAKQTNAKLWIHIQDFEFDLAFESGIFKKSSLISFMTQKTVYTIERFLLNKANVISTISNQMMLKVSEKSNNKDVFYFPNWISKEKINPEVAQKHAFFRDNKFSLLYSGNIGEKQDWNLFLSVAERLQNNTNIEIIIVGNGGYLNTLKERCKMLNNVTFHDLVPYEELNNLLCSASLHFLFQKNEVLDTLMPSKLLGMMASTRPCLVTGNPKSEVAKVLTEDCGYYIANPSTETIYEIINRISQNEIDGSKLGIKAREKIINQFSDSKVLARFKEKINEISNA
jgi:colanic acid biosynthesis glycosyl transferase WcaI